MDKLGVAVIGTGAISSVHIDAYQQFKDICEIRILCDISKDKAQNMKENKNLKISEVLEDWKKILKRNDIDIISLCLPPNMHASVAIPMLEAGKHVLVEKPMALSLNQCDKMIKAAKENEVYLSVVSQNRYKTPMMKVKKIIDAGLAGQILSATVNSLWWRGSNYYDLWWRGKWENEGGGCMISHAVHHVDLLQWMIGMPDKITAVISNNAHSNSECEDYAIAILQYPEMTAQITASLLSHDEKQEMIFQAEKARLSIPWEPAASYPLENGFPKENENFLEKIQTRYDTLPVLEMEGHLAQIKNLLDAIEDKDSLLIDGNEGRKSIELIMAIYKSAYMKKPVSLPISTDDDFYYSEKFVNLMPRFNKKTYSKKNFKKNDITLGRDVGK